MNDYGAPFGNPLMTVSDFDSDFTEPTVLCVLPAKDRDVRFMVPATYMQLVNEFDGKRTIDEAIEVFLAKNGNRFSTDQLRRLVEESLLPKGILIYPHQEPALAAVSNQSSRGFLHIKLPLMKPGFVDPVARQLSFLFNRGPMIFGGFLFIAMHLYVYGVIVHRAAIDFDKLNFLSFIALLWLSTASTIFHEFGHASAAAYYGCRRMTIGWGLYFTYKVMWTNVSEAWRLPRLQRVVVDIGGVYFESIFLLLMLLLFVYTNNSLFIFAFIFTDLKISENCNPFLRMDGYWVLSDLFGIVNLRNQQILWVKSIVARVFGNGAPVTEVKLSRKAKWALAICTVLGLLFAIYLTILVIKITVLSILAKYPDVVRHLWVSLLDEAPILDVLNAFMEVSWRTFFLFSVVLSVTRLITGGMRLAGKLNAERSALRED